jgi:TonB family protein
LKTGEKWLNPPPTRVTQVAVQHDSFAHPGDEYQMPAAGNVSDAVTDGSQIHVLPVVDPTAKHEKSADANNGTPQSVENPDDQNSIGQRPIVQGQADGQSQEANSTGDTDVRQNRLTTPAVSPSSQQQAEPNSSANKSVPSTASVAASARTYWRPTAVSGGKAGIPSSLRSQIAAMTPESSGFKPVEAAMASIEPVKLPEATTRELLTQSVEPQYPEASKASGSGGSVILQVLIGRDGVVQDAKFLQGSLVFARAAIDAVRRWRFKPYSLNGRVVSIQSTITLTFKPSA